MVLAVLEAHCGVRLSGHDVYLNVAGGLRIQEPAADLAAAAALVSSLANAPLPADAVYFGEDFALGRGAAGGAGGGPAQGGAEARLCPRHRSRTPRARKARSEGGLTLEYVASLSNLVADIAARGKRPARAERLDRAVERGHEPAAYGCDRYRGSLTRPWNRIAPVASSTR